MSQKTANSTVVEKRKPTIRNQYNYIPTRGESNTSPSVTKMDESYTIKELYQKFASGRTDVVVQQEPTGYLTRDANFDDIDLHEIKYSDFADSHQVATQLRARNDAVKNEFSAKRKAASAAALAKIEAAASAADSRARQQDSRPGEAPSPGQSGNKQ